MSWKKRAGLALKKLAVLTLSIYITGFSTFSYAAAKALPIYCVEREGKLVSLTFDAAWGNEDTQQLIDILGKDNIKATFFVVGQWAEKYPESVKALHDAGHEVMNHSSTHKHFPTLTSEQIKEDISSCNDKVEAVTGVRPILFRPPYGDYDDKVINTLRDMGMYTIQWDVDSLDWKEIPASEITSRVTSRIRPGSIVLFHNAAKHTPEALPDILNWIKENGYQAVKVSDLIIKDNYRMDHKGRQIAQ